MVAVGAAAAALSLHASPAWAANDRRTCNRLTGTCWTGAISAHSTGHYIKVWGAGTWVEVKVYDADNGVLVGTVSGSGLVSTRISGLYGRYKARVNGFTPQFAEGVICNYGCVY